MSCHVTQPDSCHDPRIALAVVKADLEADLEALKVPCSSRDVATAMVGDLLKQGCGHGNDRGLVQAGMRARQ